MITRSQDKSKTRQENKELLFPVCFGGKGCQKALKEVYQSLGMQSNENTGDIRD